MAYHVDGNNEGISRTTSRPSITSFTMMMWMYMTSLPSTAGHSFGLLMHGETSTSNLDWYICGVDSSTDQFEGYVDGSSTLGSSVSANQWYHVAMTVAGTGASQFLLYLDGMLDITKNGDVDVASQVMRFGASTLGGSPSDSMKGYFAACKAWSAVLTADEILKEMRHIQPQRTSNLFCWIPCMDADTAAGTDYSGNGNDFTINGTLLTASGPPAVWGAGHPTVISYTPAAATFQPAWAAGSNVLIGGLVP